MASMPKEIVVDVIPDFTKFAEALRSLAMELIQLADKLPQEGNPNGASIGRTEQGGATSQLARQSDGKS